MRKNVSLLQRAKDVGKWLSETAPGKVLLDPGVMFSGLHAIAFSGSPSALIQGLGFSSLALTTAVSAVRQLRPEWNKKIAEKFNIVSDFVHAPRIDSNGFPLFLNGVVLGGIALAAFYHGDFTSGSISLAYAIANTDKGARISNPNGIPYQENLWTIEGLGKKAFNSVSTIIPGANTKIGFKQLAETPPRILKHTLYLPELYGSLGAGIYGLSHSGLAVAAGVLSAAVAVTAAAVNNGDIKFPATSKIPVINKIAALSDFGTHPASDQVLSRRFMKYASLLYSAGAASLGNFIPALGHGCGAVGNAILEGRDRAVQTAKLDLGTS